MCIENSSGKFSKNGRLLEGELKAQGWESVFSIHSLLPCSQFIYLKLITFKNESKRLPWGSVVENPPANAGDMALIPDLERSHMEQSN